MEKTDQEQIAPDQLPFVAPCNKLPVFAAFDWISLGWQDFKSAPRVSMIYGFVLILICYMLSIASWYLGGAVLLLSLLSGLVFIAPVLAIGLYSVSCQIEAGSKPKLAFCVREGKRHLGNEMVFSIILLVIFLLWTKAGTGIHIFFPMEGDPVLTDYITFYAIGSLIGSVFAAIVFCASAFALPMMMDRKADAITAVITSVNAVMKNKLAMLIWISIIAACIVISFLTAFLAMVVIMPLLGYSTWHGYKQTINAQLWEENFKLHENNSTSDQLQS